MAVTHTTKVIKLLVENEINDKQMLKMCLLHLHYHTVLNNNNNNNKQPAGKALNQGSTKNSHIRRCTQTSESTNVKVQNIWRGK